jgi:hypothetical protein
MDGGLTSLERTHEWIISMSHLPTLGHIQGRIRFQGSQENHASYASYASYRINIEGKFRRYHLMNINVHALSHYRDLTLLENDAGQVGILIRKKHPTTCHERKVVFPKNRGSFHWGDGKMIQHVNRQPSGLQDSIMLNQRSIIYGYI